MNFSKTEFLTILLGGYGLYLIIIKPKNHGGLMGVKSRFDRIFANTGHA